MPVDTVPIGPFSGGLNTYSDQSSVADNEVVQLENFELDLDGSLVSRPPIANPNVEFPLGATGDVQLLGYYNSETNTPFLLASDGLSSTYYFTGDTWTLITSTIAATAFAQFDNKAWLLAPVGSVNPGGYWSPETGYVTQPNMPMGDVIVSHKLRLWVAVGGDAQNNGTRMYFSEVIGQDPFWDTVPNFIDVGGGDGQNIVQIVEFFTMLVIFRTGSIYSFAYSTDPTAGVVQLLVPNVGLTDNNCVAVWQSYMFFLFNDRLYQFVNNRAQIISTKVPFESSSRLGIYMPYNVSIFNNRVIVSYWDKLYVYSLNTQVFCEWKSDAWGPIGTIVAVPPNSGPSQAVCHQSVSVVPGIPRSALTLQITDEVGNATEAMTCIVQTKNYDYQAPQLFKRMIMAGVDGIFRSPVVAQAVPINFVKTLTWGQLRAQFTWGQLLSKTWGTLSSDSSVIETDIDESGSASQRKFIKLFQSLYFRQIHFSLSVQTDGSVQTAPVRIFGLITYIIPKEIVSKTES